MWDQSQLKLALGATGQNPSEAKSVAASTDAGESVEAGEPVMTPAAKLEGSGAEADGKLKGGAQANGTPVGEGAVVEDEVEEVKKRNEALEHQNAAMVAELESLRRLLEVKDEAAKQADSRANDLEAKIAEQEKEHQIVIADKAKVEKELEAKVAEVATLKAQVPVLEKELEDFKVQNSELALGFSRISESKKEVETRSEMLKQSKDASDEALKKMTDRLRDMQGDRDSLASRLDEAEKALDEKAAEVDKANLDIKTMTDALPKGRKELQDQIVDLNNQVHKTEVLLEDSKQEKASIEAKLVELRQSERDNMYMGILGGAASTLCIGGLYQLCIGGFRK